MKESSLLPENYIGPDRQLGMGNFFKNSRDIARRFKSEVEEYEKGCGTELKSTSTFGKMRLQRVGKPKQPDC